MIKRGAIFIVFLTLITSCKSSKITDASIANLSARNIIKNNDDLRFDKINLRANLFVKYDGKAELPNLNASMRMVKDSVIWISFSKLGFPVAKLMITQDSVRFYEKISKTYFDGDFELISQSLGTDFDFTKVQNLFLGETLIDMKLDKYKSTIDSNLYRLNSKNKNAIFEVLFWISPNNFKLKKEEIKHPFKEQILTILYKDFDKIDESLFPKGFIVQVKDKNKKTRIEVNYKNVFFNTNLSFPFAVPNGYKKIELK
jgi:hypothetical protein